MLYIIIIYNILCYTYILYNMQYKLKYNYFINDIIFNIIIIIIAF